MTKDEAIKHFGSVGAVAAALGIKQPSVSDWGEIPPYRQLQLEILTKGKLKADQKAFPSGRRVAVR